MGWRLLLIMNGMGFQHFYNAKGHLYFYFRTKASPVLWRIFIEFEIRVGDLKKAKKLLFRAIGECPTVKGDSQCMPQPKKL